MNGLKFIGPLLTTNDRINKRKRPARIRSQSVDSNIFDLKGMGTGMRYVYNRRLWIILSIKNRGGTIKSTAGNSTYQKTEA